MSSHRSSKQETIYDACRRGNAERVEEYLSKGGCVTECDDNKMTMLHHLAFAGSLPLVQRLLAVNQRVELDAADSDGWTALHYAADKGHAAVAECLLKEGAGACARDANKRTPLHLAALGNHVDVVRVLLANGGSKTAKNVAGMTPVDCARAAEAKESEEVLTA